MYLSDSVLIIDISQWRQVIGNHFIEMFLIREQSFALAMRYPHT